MKKALVLALTVLMVLSLATAAFAVEVTYEGKVAVTFGGDSKGDTKNGPAFAADTLDAKIFVDYQKDYGDGVTAGVKTKLELDKDEAADDLADGFKFDGAGWIQLEKDLYTLKAATGIDAGVGRDLKEFNIVSAPGLSLNLNLIDGLTLTSVVNAGEPAYNYVLKGEYADDLFKVGGGFQSDEGHEVTLLGLNEEGEEVEETFVAEKTTAFGIYGTANLIDGLTLNAEFGSRTIKWGKGAEGAEDWKSTALLAKAAYEVDALNAAATFLMQNGFFKSLNDDDADQDWRIIDFYRFYGGMDKLEVMAVAFDASYDLTDALTLEGYFDYVLSEKFDGEKAELEDPYAYKLGAAYTIIEPLTAKAWYKAFGSEVSQFGGNVSYKLVEDVTTSFEVTSTTEGDNDPELKYTAKIEAAF